MKYYTVFEIRLIFKDKKLRRIIWLTILWIGFTYLQQLIGNTLLLGSSLCKLLYYPLLISLSGAYYAQCFSNIEANVINIRCTCSDEVKLLLYRNYLPFGLVSLVITLLLSPTLISGVTVLELITYYMLGIGPIFFIAFQTSRFNALKIDFSMSAFMNSKEKSGIKYSATLFLLILFLGTIAGIALLLTPDKLSILYYCLLALSPVFVFTRRVCNMRYR